jgi:hypothetical protein
MSDELINRDSPARKWLKIIAWAYVVVNCVAGFTGLLDRIVPLRYGMIVSYGGIALIMLAYRRPGSTGWLLVLLGWSVIAVAIYSQLTR